MESGGRSRLLSFRNLLFRNLKPEFMAQNFKEASLKLRSQRLRNNSYTNVKQGYHFKANYFSDPCLLHERFFGNMSSRFSQNAQL